VCHLSEKV